MKKWLKNYLRTKLGVQAEIANLQARHDFLSALVTATLPEIIEPEPQTREMLQAFLEERFGITKTDFRIHKNDLMFQNRLYHSSHDVATAWKGYFTIGAKQAQELYKLALKHKANQHTVLDFGSGYGRGSRFLPHYFPDAEIYVSEVKPMSLDFQQKAFGFKPVSHTSEADSFPKQKFDLIQLRSVFTHLPEHHFKAWFSTLVQSLNQGGMILFTYNDTAEHPNLSKDFNYTRQSEDASYHTVDRLSSAEDYGLTIVSRSFLNQLAQQNDVKLELQPKPKPGHQSVALVFK